MDLDEVNLALHYRTKILRFLSHARKMFLLHGACLDKRERSRICTIERDFSVGLNCDGLQEPGYVSSKQTKETQN